MSGNELAPIREPPIRPPRTNRIKFWMGHAGEDMSDLYDKIKEEVAFRKEVAEKAGLGFHLPSKISAQAKQFSYEKCSIGPNGPKLESARVFEMAVNA